MGTEIRGFLDKHDQLTGHLAAELVNAKAGIMPNLSVILELAFRLNVVTAKDMIPVLEKYQVLAREQREELEADFKAL